MTTDQSALSIEINMVIICACIPILPRLVKFLRETDILRATRARTAALTNSHSHDITTHSGYKVFDSYFSNQTEIAARRNQDLELQNTSNSDNIVKSVRLEQSWTAI